MIFNSEHNIMFEKWSAQDPEYVFILVHGMGAHTGRWEFLAKYFANKNISSYAIELKGFGGTDELKGHIESFDIYYKDIIALTEIARKENPDKKIILCGESMGGLISFVLASRNQAVFDSLVLISPAFKNGMKINVLDQLMMIFYLGINSRKQFTMPFNASMCTRDEEYQNIMNSDKREHRFATSRLLIEIVNAQTRSTDYAKTLKIPTLFLLAGKDYLVDTKAAEKIFRIVGANNYSPVRNANRIIKYPSMHHALSIDIGRDNVFADIYEWIGQIQ